MEGNTVLLYGKVLNPDLKGSAATVAAAAQGVTNVINHITLIEDSPSENRIPCSTRCDLLTPFPFQIISCIKDHISELG